MAHSVFVTGGTGYIGSRLIPLLAKRGYQLKALVRAGSANKLPAGAIGVTGSALQMDSYAEHIRGSDTFIHLVGVPHPSPTKAKQFQDIDLVSIEVAIKAARNAGVRHFIYLSVAHPAPMMKEFIAVRSAGEQMIRESGINATFVRPWYVLGPGHWWPYAILPVYWLLEKIPAKREAAERLGLVTIHQMLNALVWAVENPPSGFQTVDVPRIRELSRSSSMLR
jgi:uncharacterized protein YbjT (DUF2867 family)